MGFGKNLKRIRENNGYTQSALSKKTGIPQTTISGWETGKYVPDITEAVILARTLNCSLESLIDQDQANLPPTGTDTK